MIARWPAGTLLVGNDAVAIHVLRVPSRRWHVCWWEGRGPPQQSRIGPLWLAVSSAQPCVSVTDPTN